MTDPYKVLGVSRDADQPAIRKAFKKLARKYHPDINKDSGAEDRFKQINTAYDILGDEKKRALWDEFGEASTRPGFDADTTRAYQSGGSGFPFNFGGGGVDMEDLLGSLFGSGGPSRGPRRGADQTTSVAIDFMTTVLGGEVPITLQRPDGVVEDIRVPVPAGASHGGKVRLKGRGSPPLGGGPCGDLVIHLQVGPHPILRRTGNDLEMDLPITVHEAMSGGSVTVPTPTGDVRVTIPKGARNGARLRIKGRGIQRKGRAGHLYLVLRPTVPNTEDPAMLAAAEALESAYGNLRAGLKL